MQKKSPTELFSYLTLLSLLQNISFSDTSFAYTISEQKFAVWAAKTAGVQSDCESIKKCKGRIKISDLQL